MMREAGGSLVLVAAYSTCLLLFALLLSALFAPFDLLPFHSLRWEMMGNWRDGLSSNNTRVVESLEEIEPLEFLMGRLVRGEDRSQLQKTGFSCHTDLHSKVCLTKNPTRINNNNLKFYISTNNDSEQTNFSPILIHPYARQEDKITLRDVTPLQIVFQPNKTLLPLCQFIHNVPVLIFSTGGFTGNLFHEFDETIIPLFITSYHFRTGVQFLITDHKPWWVRKYNRILSGLSRYNVINPDEDGGVHCFNGGIIGLKFHNILSLNNTDIPGGYSMADFRSFLRQTYNLKVKHVKDLSEEKPMVMLISRQNSRRFMNEGEMVEMMKEVGFEVMPTTPQRMSNLDKFSSVVNLCSVIVGAHGAGLTNELFLADGAVVVQVVPFGLDWPSTFFFGKPAAEMELEYLEYKIEAKESSLWEKYGENHTVIRDPQSIFAKGYFASRAIYIDGQNLNINLTRFRDTMIQVKKLIEEKKKLVN
ncbi:alpha-1,3-arabinosyltransferase XAT2-like [Benincasa hispida]|uniref:alpha-1,3-arabinosyltransferase XAT2-like n=1 Tax=Benincasa hispida TaxID=102211 RepID=UPI0019010F33|nr:alpha-1,3-arabinosyltransferase XAT2-like [Benincasa hispida]